MAYKAFLRAELKEYLKTAGNMSPAEKHDLLTWVAEGKSVYDNPFLLYNEDGQLMDYIDASRANAAIYEDHINATNMPQFEPDEEPGLPF